MIIEFMISNIKDKISQSTTALSVLCEDGESDSGDSKSPSRLNFQYILEIDSNRLTLK